MPPVPVLRALFRKAFVSAIYDTPATSVMRKLDFSIFSPRLRSISCAFLVGWMNNLLHILGVHPLLCLPQRPKQEFASSIVATLSTWFAANQSPSALRSGVKVP